MAYDQQKKLQICRVTEDAAIVCTQTIMSISIGLQCDSEKTRYRKGERMHKKPKYKYCIFQCKNVFRLQMVILYLTYQNCHNNNKKQYATKYVFETCRGFPI